MSDLIPDFASRVLLAVGGILGSLCSFLFGPVDDAIQWLLVFIVVDYLSGTFAALKSGQWNSRTGFIGIAKKIIILSLVALCHGLDTTSIIPFVSIRDVAVFASMTPAAYWRTSSGWDTELLFLYRFARLS